MILGFFACLLAGTANGQGIQPLGPCEPGFVKHWQHGLPIRLATTGAAAEDTASGSVLLEWLGHSSFLLTSPGGLRLLTDPNGWHPIVTAPDAVTVSNFHATHSDVSYVPGTPQVLWGLTPERGWNQIALTLKDVSLFNVPSYASRTELEESPVQNSIFVFRTGGLCIVHLGNLRHPLTPRQLQRIGKPDVLMIPADGMWTMPYDDVLTVIRQLQPLLVIPMHIEAAQHAEVFVQGTAGRYRVRRLRGRVLTLHRAALPAATEIVVFSNASAP
jgi:L-ascorbate metabolism protein UlaG (beta-lactamase superfamily)